MNGVPGVITFESNGRLSDLGGTSRPSRAHSSRSRVSSSSFSAASCAARKRRARCWFILARGATPSIAMKRSFRGRQGRCKHSLKVIKDGQVHVILGFWRWPVLGMRRRVNDAIHIKVQIVILVPIRIWLRPEVHWDLCAVL